MDTLHGWRIRLFGTLRIEACGAGANRKDAKFTEQRNPAGKARSLLAYLLLYPGIRLTREQVMDALWADAPLDRARRALSDALYRLRETPVGALVESEGEEIALAAGADLWVDVWEFQEKARAQDSAAIDSALLLAVAPLLPEIYDDWIIARRAALQEERIALLRRRALLAEEENDLSRANLLYQQIIDDDNLDEAAWRGRMRTLARMGHLRDALDTWQRLAELLDEELGVPPEMESSELAARIRREYDAQRSVSLNGQGSTASLPVFVGRLRERAQLIAALDSAMGGQGGMRMVLADVGMGRTALLHELEQSARWRGAQVVWGRAAGEGLPQPYAPLRAALAEALPEARVQQLEEFMRPPWLAAVQQLLSEPEAETAVKQESRAANPVRTLEELALAVGSALRTLGEIVPHLVLLDDMQWADRSLWQLLDALRPMLAQSRVLLVLSSRLADVQNDTSIRERLTTWEQAGDIAVQTLTGLGETELGELLAHRHIAPLAPEALSTLHRDSGGNPLLAIMLAASQAGGSQEESRGSGQQSASDFARTYLLRRVRSLPTEQQRALEAGAVLGTHFGWQMWAAFWRKLEGNPAQLPLIAGQLEQQDFLHLDGAHYRFSSTLLQNAIVTALEQETARELHRHAFAALERLENVPLSERLRHAQLGGLREQSHRFAIAAARAAAANYSMHSARDYYTLALENVDAENEAARYAIHVGRGMAVALLGMREEQASDFEAARALAERLDDDEKRLEIAILHSEYLLTTGQPHEALEVATAALSLTARDTAITGGNGGNSDNMLRRTAQLYEILARIQRERKQSEAALAHLEAARAIYEQLQDDWGVAHTIDTRGGLAWDAGDYQRAARDHLEAANRFAAIGDILKEAKALNNLGSTYWELGDYAGARTTHERAMTVFHDAGDLLGEGDNIDNLGGVYWSLGDYDTAIEHYAAALKIRRAIRDEWGISISLGNLGSALLQQGNVQAALDYYEEAYPRYRKIGRLRSEGYVLHYIGVARLELGEVDAALEAMQRALEIREEIGDQSKVIETRVAMTQAHLAAGNQAQARSCMDAALTRLEAESYPPALQQEVHHAAWRVARAEGNEDAAREHVGRAEVAMAEIVATLPPDAVALFLANVPLNRQVSEAIAEYATTVEVQMARADAPRGRPLRPDEQIRVQWTVATPGDALLADPAERRRRALLRLLDEAAQAGGSPTDDLLAEALGVSRRTILRDIEALGGVAGTRFRS